ncbi:hypothetical protein Tco_0935050 [Tanacetum coccineum]
MYQRKFAQAYVFPMFRYEKSDQLEPFENPSDQGVGEFIIPRSWCLLRPYNAFLEMISNDLFMDDLLSNIVGRDGVDRRCSDSYGVLEWSLNVFERYVQIDVRGRLCPQQVKFSLSTFAYFVDRDLNCLLITVVNHCGPGFRMTGLTAI